MADETKKVTARVSPFVINGETVAPGTGKIVDFHLGLTASHAPMTLPVQVVHGRKPGPVLFVSAAIHGDEILGIEIIRRVLKAPALKGLAGTLLAIPIVNGPGFISHSRYLPDRRDLNRSFPGSDRGSLAARLADTFLTEIVKRSDFGIDLHTAALHRTNYPQIRFDTTADERLRGLANAFGAPVTIESKLRPGSLRETAKAEGVECLLYEAGEALRFDEFSIRVGVRGVLAVMRQLGMISTKSVAMPIRKPVHAKSSSWVRAPEGGLIRAITAPGSIVKENEVLGLLDDPFGAFEKPVLAPYSGILIGRTNLPVVNQGDALFHIARLDDAVKKAEARIDALEEEIAASELFDEDEII